MLSDKKLKDNYVLIARLRGFLTFESFKLFNLLSELTLKDVVGFPLLEIGVFCGRSLVALACAFENRQVVGVDPFFEDFVNSPASKFEANNLKIKSNNMSPKERIKNIWEIVQLLDKKNGTNISSLLKLIKVSQNKFLKQKNKSLKFQLVHVDGEHTYSAVNVFLNKLEIVLSPGAWLIIDDIFNKGYPDIPEAVFTHRGFKNQYHPVFYGFNKGVFIYKPKQEFIKSVKKRLFSFYKVQENAYITKKCHDSAVVVSNKPNYRLKKETILKKYLSKFIKFFC